MCIAGTVGNKTVWTDRLFPRLCLAFEPCKHTTLLITSRTMQTWFKPCTSIGGPNTKWTFVPAGGAPDRFYILLSVSSNLRISDSAHSRTACSIRSHRHPRASHPTSSAYTLTPLPPLDGACRPAWLPSATRATWLWPWPTAAIRPPISRPSPIPHPAWSGWSFQFHPTLPRWSQQLLQTTCCQESWLHLLRPALLVRTPVPTYSSLRGRLAT